MLCLMVPCGFCGVSRDNRCSIAYEPEAQTEDWPWTHLGVSRQHTSAGVDWVSGPESSPAHDGLTQPQPCHHSQGSKYPSWPLTTGLTQSALAGRHRRDGSESPKPRAAALADLSFGLCCDKTMRVWLGPRTRHVEQSYSGQPQRHRQEMHAHAV